MQGTGFKLMWQACWYSFGIASLSAHSLQVD